MYRKWLKFIVLSILGLAGAAMVLEVGLRVLGAHHPVLYQQDPILGFRLKPDQHVQFFGNQIDINEYGVRDERRLNAKTPNTTRILVLGDSVTWGGIQIPQQELFTSVMEQALGDAEVINAGINGYSVWRMTALYREYLYPLEPDVILLYVIPGDFYRVPVVDLVRSSPAFPLKNSTFALSSALASARIVGSARMGWDWLRPPSPGLPRENRPDDELVRLNLDAIISLAQELKENQRLFVVVSPFLDNPENPPLPPIVSDTLSDSGIELWTLDSAPLHEKANFMDHIHLSPQGHKRVGETLAELLRNAEGNSE